MGEGEGGGRGRGGRGRERGGGGAVTGTEGGREFLMDIISATARGRGGRVERVREGERD